MPQMVVAPSFPRLHEYAGVWAMERGSFFTHWEVASRLNLQAHISAMALEPQEVKSQMDMVPVTGGKSIAIISVVGTMMKQRSSLGDGTSTVQLRKDIRAAAADPNVLAILLAIESPGGTVMGLQDLVDDVRNARKAKPVWAHVDDLAASAAYWLASATEQIFANNQTALVGSIGAILTVYDLSTQAANEGIKTLVFSTGPLKGAGTPGTAVTEEQAAYFQGLVDGAQREFDRAVMKGRDLTEAQLATSRTGAVFYAPEAMDRKLINGVQPLEKTIAALTTSASRRARASQVA